MAARSADFLIAGAGPAGSLAAELLAARGFDVRLLDPRAPWEKPCGGGLTAAARRHLPSLTELRDLALPVRALRVMAPGGAGAVSRLRAPIWMVSRVQLGRWMLERALRVGVTFNRTAVRGVCREGRGWRVVDKRGDVYLARWLVAADGAASTLRPLLAPSLNPGRTAARVAYPPGLEGRGDAVVRFLPGGDGYAWDFPRLGRHSVGAVASDRGGNRRVLDGAVTALRADAAAGTWAGAVLATWDWREGRVEDLGGPSYALLGEAAGLADPLMGEGIEQALRSARLAAETFDPESGFARYPRAVARAWRPDRRRVRALRRWERRWAVNALVGAASRWPGGLGATLLDVLGDAVNEHRPVGALVRRAWRERRAGPRFSPAVQAHFIGS